MHLLTPTLIAFLVTAGVVTISPGLDTALVLRTAASEGSRQAALAGLGIALGCLGWAALVAAGLGALLLASRLAYDVLRFAGAAYLFWMAYKLLRNPRRTVLPESPAARTGQSAFARGALTNLLNPKVGVFYVSFLPQFVPAGAPVAPYVMMLGIIHALQGVIWFACLITATRSLSRWLQRAGVVTLLDRATGGLFLAFGIGLALESRHT
jgi:threonine/homoserine/homoserine lactone efflux protein